ncbi:MAG: DNA-directed RNA polymerase subunit alpha C-terminal domain-containing protein [Planctomycetota bacterium]|nr:DNA-directed RNA polymerase subunit alpha C-terminal domain-containing protein [Planctomycetota bacterium]
MHDSPDYRREVEDALQADAEGAKGALRRATALYLLSRPEEAGDVLTEAGDSQQAVLLRGLAALETSDPTTAAASFISLVGTDMENATFLTNLATASALSGDTAMAQKAAAKLEDGADALYAEGIALESDGEYGEACKKYEEAIEKDPSHARALFRLAHRQDTKGNDDRAIELYARCIQLNPAHVNALQNLALLYEDAQRWQEAESCYRRVLNADSNNVHARLGLKDVLASQNMFYDEDHERREDRRAQVLRTPITEFELSVRSRNCLSKMNIQSLGDLVRKTEQELLAYKNFGETSLQEIKDILAQKNLRLGMGRDDDTAPLYTPESKSTAEAQLDALFGPGPTMPAATAPAAAALGSAPAPAAGGDPMDVPIESLDFSIRARRCMENLEIRTVGDLMQHTETALLASKNFGQTSLNEVRRKLDGLGVSLRRK